MSEETSIQVNFARPIPVFPLDTAALLPHQVIPLQFFEPRYIQMMDHIVDGAGQIAVAVFKGDRWKQEYHGRPPIRPYVCIGQVLQHEKRPDGRYNVLLQGVCRARIVQELPAEEGLLYRQAMLEPVGLEQPDDERLSDFRARLEERFTEGPLTRLEAAESLSKYIRGDETPTSVIVEILSFSLVSDAETRYKLLAEPDAQVRAELLDQELSHIAKLIRLADHQRPQDWPKGCSWN